MPKVSVVMPVYNVERYVARSIRSVLAQTFPDFELIIVIDGSTDSSRAICEEFTDRRIRVVRQENRGLAGARNTGIRFAMGDYIALLDSDDLWEVEKLARHVDHLDANPHVGVSFSGSRFIDEEDEPLGLAMRPRLAGIDAGHIFCRNPVGNGSAPVIRRKVFEEIAFTAVKQGEVYAAFFDESFRYGEDIECWMRIACCTQWKFEGIPGELTLYRIVPGGLSANTGKMFEHWQRMFAKICVYAPELAAEYGSRARAYQLRYYSRRLVKERRGFAAIRKFAEALWESPLIALEEPAKTLATGGAAIMTALLPAPAFRFLEARLASRT